ncbi:MAG TPA: hypothetical protein VI874_04725 [Candidatus Norongarragalinales archaeon]|nr:hypothetical protein [Candidatus Norongarragalinales archaeon]
MRILEGVSKDQLTDALRSHAFHPREVYVSGSRKPLMKKTISDALLESLEGEK